MSEQTSWIPACSFCLLDAAPKLAESKKQDVSVNSAVTLFNATAVCLGHLVAIQRAAQGGGLVVAQGNIPPSTFAR
jgi:hypothetical protein